MLPIHSGHSYYNLLLGTLDPSVCPYQEGLRHDLASHDESYAEHNEKYR